MCRSYGQTTQDSDEPAVPGDLVDDHVKKLGRIPDGGGGRVSSRDSEPNRRSKAAKDQAAAEAPLHAATSSALQRPVIVVIERIQADDRRR